MIFNFIGFFGHIAFYRIFADIFKGKKWPVIIGCFLLPSTLYFSSGIHKDLIVFTALGLYCYALYFSLQVKLNYRYVFTLLASFITLLFIRNFVAVAIIPATLAIIISKKVKINTLVIFVSTYIITIIMLWLVHLINPSVQPVKIIAQKQQDFFELPYASSQIETHILEPNAKSLLQNTPEALNHGLLRPYIWEHPTTFLIPLSIELFIYHILFVLLVVHYRKKNTTVNSFILFGIFVSVSLLLFTGYIVPNIGSIVRYRSLYLPFLITPMLCCINWKKIARITY